MDPVAKPIPSPKPSKVTEDLLNRLNSQLPNAPAAPPQTVAPSSIPPLPSFQQAMAEMEDKYSQVTKQLNDKIKELKVTITPIEGTVMGGDTQREDITTSLREIVSTFNNSLEEWYKKTGCVVNFSWGYKGFKKLEIAGIDFIVYRKEAPSEETIKAVLSRGEPS